jgi:hypothetical protein
MLGKTVFDYVPLHPALTNPKKVHRYLITVWKQKESLDIDKSAWKAQAENDRKLAALRAPHERLTEGPGELAMEYRERSIPFPTLKFARDHGLTLAGFSFITSSFNIETLDLVKKLGLHQPVYAKVRQATSKNLVEKLETATMIAATLPSSLKDISKQSVKALNEAHPQILPVATFPTRRDLKALDQGDKGPYVLKVEGKKQVRLSVFGAVGLSKRNQLEKDVVLKGSIKETVKMRPYRFANA